MKRPATALAQFGVRPQTALPLTLALLSWAACSEPSEPERGAPPSPEFVTAPTAWYLLGAGDIAGCATTGDEATATLLDGIITSKAAGDSITVFTAGDNVYENATAAEYSSCYNPNWGRQKGRTRPTLGNHEYNVSVTPSFDYYNGTGNADGPAGPRGKGYYSYDLGTWHIIVLNDNILSAPEGAVQSQWLKQDLAGTRQQCVLAMWHQPRFYSTFSTTSPGLYAAVRPFWVDLYQAGADIVVNGHQHMYERFGPQNPDGNFDDPNGIREFIVGTGGKSNSGTPTNVRANSVVRDGNTYGVWKLTLGPGNYTWQFRPIAGKTFTDTPVNGTKNCHARTAVSPPPPPPPTNAAPTAAFTPSCTGLSCSFGNQSSDADGSVVGWSWNFGDNTTSTAQNPPAHRYQTRGPYTVQLTVTDNGSATGSTSRQATPRIELSASGSKVNGVQRSRLTWAGSTTALDVYRGTTKVATTSNTGAYEDNLGVRGPGSYVYKVCETNTTASATCSNTATVTF
jgi:PKD repeat protein